MFLDPSRPRVAVLLAFAAAAFAASSSRAADPGFGPEILDGPESTGPENAVVTARLEADPKADGEGTLSVTVELPPSFYMPSTADLNPKPTTITIEKAVGFEAIDDDWKADHAPKKDKQPAFDGGLVDVEKFVGEVTWSKRVKLTGDRASASLVIDSTYCSTGRGGLCVPLRETVGVRLGGSPVSTLPPEFVERPTVLGGPSPGEVHVALSPRKAAPGDVVTLEITIDLDEKWHVYSAKLAAGLGAVPTELEAEAFGLEPVDENFAADRDPALEPSAVDEDENLEFFEESVTWSRKYRVAEPVYGVRGSVKYQTCAKQCKPPVTVAFAVGGPAADRAAVGSPAPEQPQKVSEPGAAAPEKTDAPVEGAEEDLRKRGLVPFLVAAVIAGFLALLTPCVFPMVPITVSFFLKQSEKEHAKPLALATVYAFGIVLTFTVLGVLMAVIFGATGLTQLANNPWLNLAIAGMLVFFGANLLGLFEIRMPSWLVNWSSGKQGQGGYVGALFMALTFTLMSFTCTFAFAGGLLVWASKGEYYWPIVGMLAFSTAFALPFFFLALFPSWLQKLPKSGGWMNTVKVTMGMVEVGAAVKFLSVADLAWNPEPFIFDAPTVLTAWIVISMLTGMYLLGTFRLGHDTPSESISVTRLAFATMFLGLSVYIAVGVFSPKEPEGYLWRQIAAFAPGTFEGGNSVELGPYLEHDGHRYALDVDQAIKYAKANNKPLFFDFTGVNCTNCREMELRMKEARNRELLEEYVGVQLFLDKVPKIRDQAEADRLLKKNTDLAVEWLGNVAMPSYAIVTPDGELMPGVEPFIGQEVREGSFTEFLEKGLRAWDRQAAAGSRRLASR